MDCREIRTVRFKYVDHCNTACIESNPDNVLINVDSENSLVELEFEEETIIDEIGLYIDTYKSKIIGYLRHKRMFEYNSDPIKSINEKIPIISTKGPTTIFKLNDARVDLLKLLLDGEARVAYVNYIANYISKQPIKIPKYKSLPERYDEMKCNLKCLLKANCPVILKQKDFDDGTVLIIKSGVYKLGESISFNPNSVAALKKSNPSTTSYEAGDVLSSQFNTGPGTGKYSPAAFGIGFFAAISVSTCDVVIDLNGYTLEQSEEHALQQRFYANIELASQPFLPTQGPHSFGDKFKAAKNCFIINGMIGRSAHHGIHGNNNKDIFLKDVEFKDYEVAALHLNRVKGLYMKNCTALRNRKDVGILGIFSAARFLRPYINRLVNIGDPTTINGKTVVQVKQALKDSLNNVYEDLITNNLLCIDKAAHLTEWKLYNNKHKVIDGNSYGFAINSKGVAVNGFPESPDSLSRDIYMNKVTVQEHKGWINEVPALNSKNGIQNDAVGAVFQTLNRDADDNLVTINGLMQYIGNVVSDTQLLVTKALQAGADFEHLSTSRLSISAATVLWAEGSLTWKELIDSTQGMKCNGDSMFHVNKGVIGFKMDGGKNILLEYCKVERLENLGPLGSNACSDDTVVGNIGEYINMRYKNGVGKSHPAATYFGYGGSNVRAFSFCSSKNVTIRNCSAKNICCRSGSAFGIDIHRYSECINVYLFTGSEIWAGLGTPLDDYNDNPTSSPVAYGIHIEEHTKNIELKCIEIGKLISPYKVFKVLKEEQ